jgi:hypothetical protein
MASAVRGRLAIASGGRRDLYAAARRGVQVVVCGSMQDACLAESFAARDTHDTFATPTGNIRNRAEKFLTGRSRAVHEIRDFPRRLVISY